MKNSTCLKLEEKIMDLERQNEKIKWFKKEDLRIKQIYEENETQISVNLNGYNLCFTLMMFDFIDHIKKDLLLDVKVTKLRNNQHIFIVDTKYVSELINYIVSFIDEWNIKINETAVSDSDSISDESWYS